MNPTQHPRRCCCAFCEAENARQRRITIVLCIVLLVLTWALAKMVWGH